MNMAMEKTIYLIVIHFNSEEKNIVGFEWEASKNQNRAC